SGRGCLGRRRRSRREQLAKRQRRNLRGDLCERDEIACVEVGFALVSKYDHYGSERARARPQWEREQLVRKLKRSPFSRRVRYQRFLPHLHVPEHRRAYVVDRGVDREIRFIRTD